MEYRVVPADDHIDMPWLPQDLWQKRVPAAWRERAPRRCTGSRRWMWQCEPKSFDE